MKLAHHGLELADLLAHVAGAAVARVGREEVGGVVAPVVVQAFIEQMFVVEEVMHGHQLDGRDAERGQLRQTPFDAFEAAHQPDVKLVEDGFFPGPAAP